MDIAAYLKRIGYVGGKTPTADNLAALVKAHRRAVPYENLDLWRGKSFEITTEAIYKKIVEEGRGGYCFELNGLFAALLRALGYEVEEYAGRWFYRNDTKLEVPRFCHRVICVRVEGKVKIVDVGLGYPILPKPLDLVLNLPQTQDGIVYRVVKDSRLGLVVEMLVAGAWTRLCSFFTAPQEPTDFDYPHWWCETSPESAFRRALLVFKYGEEGSYRAIRAKGYPKAGEALEANYFEGNIKGGVTKTPIPDFEAFDKLLAEKFGIKKLGRAF